MPQSTSAGETLRLVSPTGPKFGVVAGVEFAWTIARSSSARLWLFACPKNILPTFTAVEKMPPIRNGRMNRHSAANSTKEIALLEAFRRSRKQIRKTDAAKTVEVRNFWMSCCTYFPSPISVMISLIFFSSSSEILFSPTSVCTSAEGELANILRRRVFSAVSFGSSSFKRG